MLPRSIRSRQARIACLAVPLLAACGSSLPNSSNASTEPTTSVEIPQAPQDAAPFPPEQREVSIVARGLALSGTLHLPARPSSGTPVPAVVLIHGSGPHSRSPRYPGQLNMSFGFDVPVFEQLTARLTSAGNAVVRYDKRSCGPFNGCADNGYPAPPADLTIDAFANDVQAAVDYLAALPEVDAQRIFLVGHSQGAKLALEVLARGPAVRAAVMLAANHRPVDALLAYQVDHARRQLAAAGMSGAQTEQALAPAISILQQAQAARNAQAGPEGLFLRSWIELDDRAPVLVEQLARPVLALGGDYDWNVPAEDLQAWRDAFDRVPNNPGHQAVLLPCVTHAMNCVTEPDPAKLTAEDLSQELHPAVADQIVAFLRLQR